MLDKLRNIDKLRKMKRKLILIILIIFIGTHIAASIPEYLTSLQSVYGGGSCATCHMSSGGGSRNSYGTLFENRPNHASDPVTALAAIGAPSGTNPTTTKPAPTTTSTITGTVPLVNCYVIRNGAILPPYDNIPGPGPTTTPATPTTANILTSIKPFLVPANMINPNDPMVQSQDMNGQVYIYKLPTNPVVYVYTSSAAVDCDGQVTTECALDPTNLGDTSFHQSDGRPLNPATLPWYVLPETPNPIFDYAKSNIAGGQLGLVLYNGKMEYGVFGDERGRDVGNSAGKAIGEVSYAMAKDLGINPNPANGGVSSGVTYIVFTGPGNVVNPIEDHNKAVTMGTEALSALLAQISPTPVPTPVTTGQGSTPTSGVSILEDHFQGTSLNTATWPNLYTGPGWLPSGNAGSYYRTENIIVNNGLHLLINRENYNGYSYTGGGLSTDIGITSGRVEVRARFPRSGEGIVGYLLLWPVDGSWPPELDFAETTGSDANLITFTQHWGTSSNHQAQTDKYNIDVTQYHVYILELKNGQLNWYIDGNLISTQKQNFNSMKVKFAAGVWAGACDGSYGGCPSNAVLPQYLDIDYVKMYQE
jgi:beta-glucanase (GH16 family)